MKKLIRAVVDTEGNLEDSSKVIPDGMIVKIAGENSFKIGNGKDTYADLPLFLPYQYSKFSVGAVSLDEFNEAQNIIE